MGVSGTPVYAGYVLSPEKSPKLVGQEKYRTYSEMLANVSIIAAGVRYFLNIVAKPAWSAEAPEDSGDEGEQYVDFVNDVLLEDLHTPWSRVIRRCGTYRFHGFNIQEWVAKKRDDGKIGFHDIESRPQWTIWRWEVDERGTVTGAWQRDPLTGRELGLPRGKLMYMVDDTLTDSPEGMGLLRHCYEPAKRLEEFFKQEGYGYLRDLQGIPLGMAPLDDLKNAVANGQMTQAQANQALDNLVKFVTLERKDKDTGLVINSQPYVDVTETGINYTSVPKWGVQLLSGAAPGLVPINEAIVRVTTEIARILGVEHLLLGADAEGSYALAKEKARDLYLLANSVLRDIREQAQHDLMWPLWSLNGFPDEMMPQLKTEDVSPKDVEQISRVMRDVATAGAPMQPDDEIQNAIRDLLGMPHIDLEKVAQQMQQQAALQAQTMGMGPGDGSNQYEGDLAHMDQQAPQQQQQPEQPPAKKRANGYAFYADDLNKAWEETKHKRKGKGEEGGGEFTSGGGGAEAASAPAAGGDDGGKQVKQHAKTSHDISSFMSKQVKTISSSVSKYLRDNGLSLAISSAVSVGMYKMTARYLGGAIGSMVSPGVGTVAGMVLGEVASNAAYSMYDALKAKTGLKDRQVWGMLRQTVSDLYDSAKSGIGKADQAKPEADAEKTNGKGSDLADQQVDPSDTNACIVQALQALLEALDKNEPEEDDSEQQDNKDQKNNKDVEKMVPYKQAKPYRWEDEFVPGRSGAADGHMSEKVEESFDPRLGIQERSQGPYGSMKTPGKEPPLNLGDDVLPGSRMRTKGRKRVL